MYRKALEMTSKAPGLHAELQKQLREAQVRCRLSAPGASQPCWLPTDYCRMRHGQAVTCTACGSRYGRSVQGTARAPRRRTSGLGTAAPLFFRLSSAELAAQLREAWDAVRRLSVNACRPLAENAQDAASLHAGSVRSRLLPCDDYCKFDGRHLLQTRSDCVGNDVRLQ